MRIGGLLLHNLHQKIVILTNVPVSTSRKFTTICTSLTFFTSSTLSKMLTSAESLHFFQCIFFKAMRTEVPRIWLEEDHMNSLRINHWTVSSSISDYCIPRGFVIFGGFFGVFFLVQAEAEGLVPVANALLCTALIPALLLFGEVLLWLN